ncbi:MarR family winged helix-turn-helix transcriptional regulator [Celerinatantimonas yamalensis]|uniref:MarR family winged helix-turn-helix transcriptional regulator n=1 Tax=Celerinatantimonas yamalensis TaxID=559956 RepID=A0ABW9GAI7_9GAMM
MKSVKNTHISAQLRVLHSAVLDIVGVMNRPQRDELLLKAAGLTLERALFPLLVLVGKYGPIGIVEMAELIGRDYTTVSRQVARLEELNLVARQVNAKDRRIKEALVTDKGRAMTDRIDEARDRISSAIFANWEEADLDQLTLLIRRFADAIMKTPEVPEAAYTATSPEPPAHTG